MDARVAQLVEACHKHRVVMQRAKPEGGYETIHAPITLQPTLLPRAVFDNAVSAMPVWNKVINRIARDPTFLAPLLHNGDEAFTGRLIDIYDAVYGSVPHDQWPQPLMLGFFRSDYLVGATVSCGKSNQMRHVEINTIASAFPALSTRACAIHKELGLNPVMSDSEKHIVDALAAAHDAWVAQQAGCFDAAKAPPTVVFVVPENERNTTDQALIAEGLNARGIPTARYSLQHLAVHMTKAQVREGQRAPTAVVASGGGPDATACSASVFYLRGVYAPEHIPTDAEWAARRWMEDVSTVKCPSLPYHLCTWKRVQQALTDPTIRRRYCDTDAESELLESFMVTQQRLHQVDDETTQRVIADAIAHPEKYVLKTEKEGTGTLIVGDELVALLQLRPGDERYHDIRGAHLLMERIIARQSSGVLVRAGVAVEATDLESEVGIYGTVLADNADTCVINHESGYLVRTKLGNAVGGGIMSGVSAIDTVAYTD